MKQMKSCIDILVTTVKSVYKHSTDIYIREGTFTFQVTNSFYFWFISLILKNVTCIYLKKSDSLLN